MAIKQRNGKIYYYRKRREGSRVISEYVGGGPVAVLSVYIDKREREQRRLEREQERAAATSMAQIDAALDDFSRRVDLLVKAVYLSEGYHLHKRQWRKWRKSEMSAKIEPIKNEVAKQDAQSLEYELGWLVAEAIRDRKQVPVVRAFLAARPWIFDQMSVIDPTIWKTMIIKTFGDNEATIMLAEGEYKAMIASHRSEGSTPMEKALIERIGLTWLRVSYAELALMNTTELKQFEVCDKALSRAQARFLAAIKSLGEMRIVIAVGRTSRAHARVEELKADDRERRKQGESVTVTARVVEGMGKSKKSGRVVELARRKDS